VAPWTSLGATGSASGVLGLLDGAPWRVHDATWLVHLIRGTVRGISCLLCGACAHDCNRSISGTPDNAIDVANYFLWEFGCTRVEVAVKGQLKTECFFETKWQVMKSKSFLLLFCLPLLVICLISLFFDLGSSTPDPYAFVHPCLTVLIITIAITWFPLRQTTKRNQALWVFAIAIVLLALNFLFPVTSYPVKQTFYPNKEAIPGGGIVAMTPTRSFTPIWIAMAEHEKSQDKGNVYADWIIQWHIVLLLALGIICFCGLQLLMTRLIARMSASYMKMMQFDEQG
jgi:hypothetical protein